MQAGPITLTMDRDLVLRYRIVTFDGFPDRAWLERLWQAYAHPPRAAFATPDLLRYFASLAAGRSLKSSGEQQQHAGGHRGGHQPDATSSRAAARAATR